MKTSESTPGEKAGNIIGILTSFLVLCGAIFLARRNYLQGRGDRNGAWRLAAAVFLMSLCIWLFSAHMGLRRQTLGLFVMAASTALFFSCATWLLYMALEPYVRRHWPQTIISWSRVITGRLRDPLVGRDILSGMALGLAWVLIFQVGYLALQRTGARPPLFGSTRLLEGTRQTLGLALGGVLNSIVSTLIFFFVLFLLRVTLRNRWLAAAGFVAIYAAPRLLRADQFLIEAPMWLLIYGIAAVAVVRFGLVALATAIFLTNLLLNLPVTLDLAQWYAGNSLFVFLIFLALAGWSFYIALAGQRLWKEELFE